jgi:uncharacterized protein YjbI with pentapeptide repeats
VVEFDSDEEPPRLVDGHVRLLNQGVAAWNAWRDDMRRRSLSEAFLSDPNPHLAGADLAGADLAGADLGAADLNGC